MAHANGSIRSQSEYHHDMFLTFDRSLLAHLFSPVPQNLIIGIYIVIVDLLYPQFPCLTHTRSEVSRVPSIPFSSRV